MMDGLASLRAMATDGWKGAIWALGEIARLKAIIREMDQLGMSFQAAEVLHPEVK